MIGRFGRGISGNESYILAICLLEDLEIDLPISLNLFNADINFIGLMGLGLSFKSVSLISGSKRCNISSYNFKRSVSLEKSSGLDEASMETVDELNFSIDVDAMFEPGFDFDDDLSLFVVRKVLTLLKLTFGFETDDFFILMVLGVSGVPPRFGFFLDLFGWSYVHS